MIGRALSRKFIGGGANLIDPNDIPWSLLPEGWLTGGGFGMSIERAVGLPALLGTLLRLGHGVGMIPQKVYSGPAENRIEATDAWQYELLHEKPSSELTPSAFRGNLSIQIAGAGYGCVRKFKSSRGRVVELMVMDSRKVIPQRVGGQLIFEDRTGGDGKPVTRDQSDIIYVPAVSLDGGPKGTSPLTAARIAVNTGLTRQRFEQSYFHRNAEPRVVLTYPERITHDEAKQWVDLWDEDHQGEENWHGTSATGGGATVTVVPISMKDAQFVEAHQFTAEQLGAIYAMPKAFLNLGDNSPTDADWRYFVTFGLGWITASIDQAFNADRDLFPDRTMKAEHLTDALLKPDIKTRYEAYKAGRQGGWLTANEARARENLPRHPDGDELQVIPVGGGANPQPNDEEPSAD